MLDERLEAWYDKVGKKIVYFSIVLVVIFIILKLRIIGLLAPFIVAWFLAMILNPFVTWAHQKLRVHRGIGTIISMLTIMSGSISVLAFIIKKLWEQIVMFSTELPYYTELLLAQFNIIEEKLDTLVHLFPPTTALANIDTVIEEISSNLSSLLTALIPSVYGTLAKVPDVVIFIVITLLATFFMTKDYYYIKKFVKAQLSDTIVDKVVVMQKGFLQAIGGYIKTQLILMSITFTICLVGLLIFRQPYALLLSLIIGIIDALPVFGSGTILIPWAIYNMIVGDYTLGLGLLCIYGIIFVMRQVMEPKILSTQIGVYALVTIMAVYIGYKTLGVLGLIIGPAMVVMLKMLQTVGALPSFKPVDKTDYRGD